MGTEFDKILSKIAPRVARTLEFIPDNIKQICEEIRLRARLPLCLTVNGRVMFVCNDSAVSSLPSSNCFIIGQDDINKTLSLLCNNSVYLHEGEIRQGYVSVTGGYRAGVCGNFNAEGMLISISSINLRIARQIFDCAVSLLPYTKNGLLIAGPPASGKTTMLRDLVRQLSNGKNGRYNRVCVIDSRVEISGGVGVFDLGVCTDVLYTDNKAKGTQIALRTMYPDFIAFDEIGTADELHSVEDCFNAGVSIITTVHCNTANDLMHRKITRSILKSKAISCVAILSKSLGEFPKIIEV